MQNIFVTGSFDNLRSLEVRFLEEAARLGEVYVEVWPDEQVERLTGKPPKFPAAERLYFLQAIRYVTWAGLVEADAGPDGLANLAEIRPAAWVDRPSSANPARQAFCQANGLQYHVLAEAALAGFPVRVPPAAPIEPVRKKVVVTGCYDWLHSGHVRFFEECSEYGDLYVVAGNDANVRLLKGEGHPQFSQEERRYMVQAIRYVHQALITSGTGWMDAAPEIEALRPDLYAVNEDGDKPEKRQFCQEHGLEYLVLKRTPKEGLPRRESSKLRGF
jgi:cytidyltransferase-like protein